MFSGLGCPEFPPQRVIIRDVITDPERGSIPLLAHYYQIESSRQLEETFAEMKPNNRTQTLCVLVHGLTSHPSSRYLSPYVHQGLNLGYDVISLALRGSVGEGTDHYHAGLTSDLRELLASTVCAKYEQIELIGFSLGGQVVLRYAYEGADSRVNSIGAVCPPLDLGIVQRHLDQPAQWIYRRVTLSSLKKAYQKIWHNARREGQPLSSQLDTVLKVNTIYDWDQYVVLSRFRFGSISEYHQRVSLSTNQLSQISIPTLIILSQLDPVIPFEGIKHLIEPFVDSYRTSAVTSVLSTHVKVLNTGGHLGFPRKVDLNLGFPPASIERQLLTWMNSTKSTRAQSSSPLL